jgi:hypothetical protein
MNRFAVFVKCGCVFPRRRGAPAQAERLPRCESMVRIASDTIANARKSWYRMEAIAMQMSQPFTTEMTDDSWFGRDCQGPFLVAVLRDLCALCGEPIVKGKP